MNAIEKFKKVQQMVQSAISSHRQMDRLNDGRLCTARNTFFISKELKSHAHK